MPTQYQSKGAHLTIPLLIILRAIISQGSKSGEGPESGEVRLQHTSVPLKSIKVYGKSIQSLEGSIAHTPGLVWWK